MAVRLCSHNRGPVWNDVPAHISFRSRDATAEIADELAQRAADEEVEISTALRAFIAANATRSSLRGIP
jgi:hypothetical protein